MDSQQLTQLFTGVTGLIILIVFVVWTILTFLALFFSIQSRGRIKRSSRNCGEKSHIRIRSTLNLSFNGVRNMKFRILAFIAIAAMSVNGPANAMNFWDGGQILNACESEEPGPQVACGMYLGGIIDAEDTLQDVFVTIAKKRTAVAKARKLKPYLFRLSRNAALNRMKRNKRISFQEREAWEWLMLSGKEGSPTDREQQVETALATLPEKQRAILVLKFYRDKTLREIGDLLGVSANTAGSRYRYGMAKLRDLLREVPT